jgi:hypothetical protein
MTIAQHAHIYSFHILNFIFGQILFLKFFIISAPTNGGDGKFKATETKVGCYCWGQNCFGDRDGIGCWKCFNLAMKGEVELLADAVETRECCFACDVCLCSCQATLMENKHRQWPQEE